MKILALDSSAKSASVALVEDEKLLGEFYVNVGLTHSQTLVPMVSNLLSICSISPDSIDLFAVNTGPGSFTGVRIGVAAIKGMAMKNNSPCVGVSTLECIANSLIDTNCIACAVMDARCNQVYNANFMMKNGSIKRLNKDRAIAIDSLMDELERYKDDSQKIIFVGDGADLCYNVLKDKKNAFLSHEGLKYQSAKNAAFLAKKAFLEGKSINHTQLVPTYLRPIL